jgi:hypothetical protein
MKRISKIVILAAAPVLMAAIWMDDQQSFKPYKAPVLARPAGTVPITGKELCLARVRAEKSHAPTEASRLRGQRCSTLIAPCATATLNRTRSGREKFTPPRQDSTTTW